jgi:hypothetical protein
VLLKDKELTLVKALGIVHPKAKSVETLGKTVLQLFVDNGQELRLMRACIEAELLVVTTAQGTMFRRNSINSVCLAAYAREMGANYLKNALVQTIEKLEHGLEEYEIDPSKIGSGHVPAKNVLNIVARVDELLNHLLCSVHTLPKELGFACCVLASTVRRTMPNACNAAISGFLMLRFICAALTSPEHYGLEAPTAHRRRGLILLSKVIINLSNDIELGKKEDFMAPLEPLLDGARTKLHAFYQLILETFSDTLDRDIILPSNANLKLDHELMKILHIVLDEPVVLSGLDEFFERHVVFVGHRVPLLLHHALSCCPGRSLHITGCKSGQRARSVAHASPPNKNVSLQGAHVPTPNRVVISHATSEISVSSLESHSPRPRTHSHTPPTPSRSPRNTHLLPHEAKEQDGKDSE